MSGGVLKPQSVAAGSLWLSPRVLVIGWILAGVLLCVGLGEAPVRRTQEARVLETARQMVQPQIDHRAAWQRWLVPSLNGQWRLRKPPLAYWMSATAYELAGVGAFSGRLPAALCGWLTLLVTFRCGRWLMGTRGGAISAVCLFSSYMFYRYDRLAETDAPAMFFCTLAIYGWWRALAAADANLSPAGGSQDRVSSRSRGWFLIGAIGTAGAILSKGGPGAFPPIFLIAMMLAYRPRGALRNFVLSVAPLLVLLLTAPWFLYTWHVVSAEEFTKEVDVAMSGENHSGTVFGYLLLLFVTTLPWCGFLVAALVEQVARVAVGARRVMDGKESARLAEDPPPRAIPPYTLDYSTSSQGEATWIASARAAGRVFLSEPVPAGLLIWAGSIFLPLCCIGNKQPHYLLPLMPPLMLLVGGWVEKMVFTDPQRLTRAASTLIGAMGAATLLVIPAVPLVARKLSNQVRASDIAICAGAAIILATMFIVYRRHGARSALISYLAGACALMPAVVGLWIPRLEPDETRLLARQLRDRFGNAPFAFWGNALSLPLCFDLREAVPSAQTASDLQSLVEDRPGLVLIAKWAPKSSVPTPPAPFVEAARFRAGTYPFVIYTSDAESGKSGTR